MKTILLPELLPLFVLPSGAPVNAAETKRENGQRVVFLGDSITDGNTYPLLVQAAIRDSAGKDLVVINAGIGGDTAQGMSIRLGRDVLAYNPALVTLSAGVNDALGGVSVTDYSRSVTSIADALSDATIPLLILTTSICGAKYATAEKRLDEYNDWLRSFAIKRGLKVAQVNQLFAKKREANGVGSIMEADGVHPNWEGQRLMARAVLDALGYEKAPVPATLNPDLLPGVLTPWRIRASPEDLPLTDIAAGELFKRTTVEKTIVAKWREYTLPATLPQEDPWKDQERSRGFALSLETVIGPADLYQGIIEVENLSGQPKPVYFCTGAHLQGIWLNGQRIYKHTEWRGWHAGRDRLAVLLKPGVNTVLIETASQFFLSMMDDAPGEISVPNRTVDE